MPKEKRVDTAVIRNIGDREYRSIDPGAAKCDPPIAQEVIIPAGGTATVSEEFALHLVEGEVHAGRFELVDEKAETAKRAAEAMKRAEAAKVAAAPVSGIAPAHPAPTTPTAKPHE